jgi:hypothetical protein
VRIHRRFDPTHPSLEGTITVITSDRSPSGDGNGQLTTA